MAPRLRGLGGAPGWGATSQHTLRAPGSAGSAGEGTPAVYAEVLDALVGPTRRERHEDRHDFNTLPFEDPFEVLDARGARLPPAAVDGTARHPNSRRE